MLGMKFVGSIASKVAPICRSSGGASLKLASQMGRQQMKPASTYSKLLACPSSSSSLSSGSNKAFSGSQQCKSYSTEAKGDQQLAEFLNEEIATEKKVQKVASMPTKLGQFDVTLDDGRVVLQGKYKDEVVKLELNVNHSVETAMPETNPKGDSGSPPQMLSKPNFDVEIKKGKTTITFSCSFTADEFAAEQQAEDEGFGDLFTIDEVCIFENEWREETYAVSGDILDEYLYDLLMNMLEERGISNEFAEKLQEFCTNYEHSLYIKFLENLKKFASTS